MEDKPRIFGGKKEAKFWSDKPIQKNHPKYSKPKQSENVKAVREFFHIIANYIKITRITNGNIKSTAITDKI